MYLLYAWICTGVSSCFSCSLCVCFMLGFALVFPLAFPVVYVFALCWDLCWCFLLLFCSLCVCFMLRFVPPVLSLLLKGRNRSLASKFSAHKSTLLNTLHSTLHLIYYY